MKKLFAILSVVFVAWNSQAQQTPLTNFYVQNPYSLNVGYAGYNGCLEAFAGHRQQWLGFEGAPTTSYFQLHTAVKEKIGLGGTVYMDKLGQQSYLKATGSFTYALKLGVSKQLRFGIAGGIIQNQLSTTGVIVDDFSDGLVGGGFAGMSYGADFGVVYASDDFVGGIAVPQLYFTKTEFGGEGFGFKQHIVAHGTYNHEIRDSLAIQPSVVIRSVPFSITHIELAVQVLYNETFFLGAGYKSQTGFHALAGVQGLKNFTIGYSYGIPFLGANEYSTGTHEVVLGYNFCKKGKKSNEEEPTKTRTRITF